MHVPAEAASACACAASHPRDLATNPPAASMRAATRYRRASHAPAAQSFSALTAPSGIDLRVGALARFRREQPLDLAGRTGRLERRVCRGDQRTTLTFGNIESREQFRELVAIGRWLVAIRERLGRLGRFDRLCVVARRSDLGTRREDQRGPEAAKTAGPERDAQHHRREQIAMWIVDHLDGVAEPGNRGRPARGRARHRQLDVMSHVAALVLIVLGDQVARAVAIEIDECERAERLLVGPLLECADRRPWSSASTVIAPGVMRKVHHRPVSSNPLLLVLAFALDIRLSCASTAVPAASRQPNPS